LKKEEIMSIKYEELFFENENSKHQLLVAKYLMTISQLEDNK